MQQCVKCEIIKPLERFALKKGGRINTCKDCHNEYCKERYKKNKQRPIAQTKNRRKLLAAEVLKMKDTPCLDCGKKYPGPCMDFDHIGSKTMAISKMVHEGFSIENIKEEISKCELVCILCHKTRTHSRKKEANPTTAQIRNKLLLNQYRNKPCSCCLKQFSWWQMEFDHLPEFEKRESVSTMALGQYAVNAIKEEIDKCRMLCCLCHRACSRNISPCPCG